MPLFDSLGSAASADALLAVLLDATIKGTVVLIVAAAAAAAGALWRASAACRHLVWALSLVGLCLLPILSALVPGWRAPILPHSLGRAITESSARQLESADLFRLELVPEEVLHGRSGLAIAAAGAALAHAGQEASLSTGFLRAALIVWAGGASIALARLFASLFGLWRKGRQSAPVTQAAWIAVADRWTRHYGIRRPITFRVAAEGTIPATWGFSRPVVLLPAEALDWPQQRIGAVLLHELAHVARGDFLVQTLSRVACAFHWFNPFVWHAYRRLRVESERASDDLAVGAGLSPAGYARELVEVLMAARRERETPIAALAMARPNELEGRLRAILDGEKSHSRLSSLAAALLAGPAACVFFLLALVRVEAHAHDAPKLERLPDGMTIEVLGVSTHPSGKDSWWGPDGKPLASAPCDAPAEKVAAAGRDVRQVVARIRGLPQGATLNWHTTQSNSRRTSVTRKDGQPDEELQTVIGEFEQGLAACNLHFDLSLGEWTTEQKWPGTTSLGVGDDEHAYFLGKAREMRDGTAITVAHSIVDRDVRVIGIDQDGKQRLARSLASGGGGHLRGIDAEFDVPTKEIREYQIQSRPVGRYEIKNVVLQRREGGK